MITLESCQVSSSLDIGKLRKRAGSIKSWKTEMATRFSTEEVLAFITGDDNFGLSDSESSEDSNGDHPCISWKQDSSAEDFESLVGEAIPEQGLSTSDGLGISKMSEDEFEEADPLRN